MTPIEIFAGIVAVLTLVKILVIIKNPGKWVKVSESFLKNSGALMLVALIAAVYVLYQLLLEVTIIQIFAVMFFMMLLMMTSMAIYSKELLEMSRKLLKDKNIVKKSWLPILIWVLLSIWVLKELL
jgi:hypothetical protein